MQIGRQFAGGFGSVCDCTFFLTKSRPSLPKRGIAVTELTASGQTVTAGGED